MLNIAMRRAVLLVAFSALALVSLWSQRPTAAERSRQIEREQLAEPYRGITVSSGMEEGLFEIRATGVPTDAIREAAENFLAELSEEDYDRTVFPVDDPEWRKWMNQHFYDRQGMGFNQMNDAQREAGFALLDATLSDSGFQLARDIMKLNHTLGELKNNFEEYGEDLYWITVMGEPSETEPWGWQIDGHHLIVNCFVLGDQVVLTPTFVGSEPVIAESGKYEGVAIMQEHQDEGLAFFRSLNAAQRDKAILRVSKTGNDNLGEAFKDNFTLDYAGIPADELTADQQEDLIELIGLYIGIQDEEHAEVRMEEIEEYFDRTYFAWIGGSDDDSVFYYRIHSPVVLIEFDHQLPAGLREFQQGERVPIRQHVHAVIRTPNGNDYGKDLLRQHYERSHQGE